MFGHNASAFSIENAKAELAEAKNLCIYPAYYKFLSAYEIAQKLGDERLKKEIVYACYERVRVEISEALAKFETMADMKEDDPLYLIAKKLEDYVELCEIFVKETSDRNLEEKINRLRADVDIWMEAGDTPQAQLRQARKKLKKASESFIRRDAIRLFEEADKIATRFHDMELRSEIAQVCHDKACYDLEIYIEAKGVAVQLGNCDTLFALSRKSGLPVRKQPN